jgi:hypothetical protein
MWIDPGRIPLLASAVAMLLLAVVLIAMDFQKQVNRAFAAILTLRALAISASTLNVPAQASMAIAHFLPYLVLPIAPLALYFASVYPRRRGPLGRPGGGWITLAVILALEATYFVWHDGYHALAFGEAATGLQQIRGDVQATSFGPLAAIGMLYSPLLSALALVFARDYTRSEPGPQRTSYLLVAAGFLLNGLFDGTRQAMSLAMDPGLEAWWPWGWSVALLPSLSLVPAAAALAVVARHTFRERGEERRMEFRLFVAAAVAVASGLATLGSGGFLPRDSPLLVALGLWRLGLPLLVTFALLRYALFDIDIKVRAAVAWAVVAGIFAFTWFVASNLLQNVVADETGTGEVGGLVAAALMAWATPPMVRFGHWAAAKLMPGVHDFSKRTREAGELYREQFLMLQEDGNLTRKERACLERLRVKLELPKAIARRLEMDARGASPGAA